MAAATTMIRYASAETETKGVMNASKYEDNHKPLHLPLPRTAGDFTAEWATTALADHLPQGCVVETCVARELVGEEGQTAEVVRLHLTIVAGAAPPP